MEKTGTIEELMPTTGGMTKLAGVSPAAVSFVPICVRRGGISAIGCPYVGREPV